MLTDNKYIYETHLHTSSASACGKSKGNEYISLYKELGFSGIIVTDHFFNGNCCVPKSLSWEERINLYCKGYEDAKAEGDRQNFDVFFGVEYNSFNPPEQNALAYRYAQKNNIPMTAGSDIHLATNYGADRHFGVAFDTPLASIHDYVDRIKNNAAHSVHMPKEHKKWEDNYTNHLPVYLFDENNKPTLFDNVNTLL